MGKVVSLTLKDLRKYTLLILIHSPVCHKEVLDSVLEPPNDKEEIPNRDVEDVSEQRPSKREAISHHKIRISSTRQTSRS